MSNILIVGNGVVGGNMRKLFPNAAICDPPKGCIAPENVVFDVAFICVPTPTDSNGCDTSIVRKAIEENKAKVFCIRSTIPPGTTDKLSEDLGKPCVFMPEYYGETVHANGYNHDFLILGGPIEFSNKVLEVFKKVNTGEVKIFQTSNKSAELVKYMENCFLATKVVFCNEFYRIAKVLNLNYNEIREMFIADKRVGRSHTFVYESQPYYDSKCLNKDIPALIAFSKEIGFNANLMKAVEETNNSFRNS